MKGIALLGLLSVVSSFAQEPKFEVADVHLSTTTHMFAQNFGGVLRDGRYVNRDATMLKLIAAAYGVSEDSVAGGPGWLSSELFDIIARVPDGTTMATANLMLRSLLADRFSLVITHGTSPMPRYVLAVGKNGPKLKPATGSESSGCKPVQSAGPVNPADVASLPNVKVACRGLTSNMIADNLHLMAGGYLDHDVIDSTKLEGSWDFDLEWTARNALAAKGSNGISVFDAVEKQLGLKLEVQSISVPSLVIESVNRKPTENPAGVATALVVAAARFEAASIKPANPDSRMVGLLYTGGSQMRAGGTLRDLIALALQISPNVAADLLVGLPKSAESQRWDITAKVPSTGEGAPQVVNGRTLPPPLSVGLEMLRGMLLDDFELKTHVENREVTVYALTLMHDKPKFTRAEDSERSGCKQDPSAPKPVTNIAAMFSCKNTSMPELAQNLQMMANAYIDHPVVDATGLPGGWDFLIGWTAKAMLRSPQSASSNQPLGVDKGTPSGPGTVLVPDAADPGGITVFEAVEKELGLKLVKQKRSIPVMIVDHVNEKPKE